MKIYLTAFLLVYSNLLTSQVKFPINENGKIEYSGIVNVDSSSKDLLFSRSKLFVAESFKSAKAVIEMEDPSSGTLFLKGNIRIIVQALGAGYDYGNVSFTMSIQCKENKYRYIVTDLYHSNSSHANGSGGRLELEKPLCGTLLMSKKYWAQVKEQADKSVNELIKKMADVMSSSLKNDW